MIFNDTDKQFAQDLFTCVRAETAAHFGSGVTRASYSLAETHAVHAVSDAARVMGLTARYDKAANLVMSLNDGWPDKATWMGSHLDSVANGGNYDGLAGVVAALLILAKAKTLGVTKPLVGVGGERLRHAHARRVRSRTHQRVRQGPHPLHGAMGGHLLRGVG